MTKHDKAVDAFHNGQPEQALRLFEELLQEQETSELWNDWATIQAAVGNVTEAEAGLRRALQLDSQNHPAKADLGILMLSKGENAQGIKLIEECISLLPTQQQEVLQAALRSVQAKILIINDVVPNESQADVLQIIKNLQALGHRVTFLSRDKTRNENTSHLGSRVYAGDAERLPSLGISAASKDWSLPEVLESGRFNLAILTHNFTRGISVPEHYLDAIRRHSPQTRIAILEEAQHGAAASDHARKTQQLRHHELAEDWSQREHEAYQRADLVIVPNQQRITELAVQGIQAALAQEQALSQTLSIATNMAAKALRRDVFSMTLVDSIYAQLLDQTSGETRVYARLDFYIQLAEQLLRHGKTMPARDQLRHIFGWLGEQVKLAPALAQPLGLLKRCYRELGDEAMAARCGEEARRCFTTQRSAQTNAPAIRTKDQPLISLIV
ncbi:MAG TPA: hypothetical protein VH088_19325, partial [Terriglobales bacterium]|nr:hypothetical protein [Terriglobales bacterium]